MNIINVPQEHALIALSSDEILALWRCLEKVRQNQEPREFMSEIEIGTKHATELARKLSEALEMARRNVRE